MSTLYQIPPHTKYLPSGTKVLIPLIDTGIKKVTVKTHGIFLHDTFSNGGSKTEGINFDKFYSTVIHAG